MLGKDAGGLLPSRTTHAQCSLVIIGATPNGKKELIGLIDGVRESPQSWKELLLDPCTAPAMIFKLAGAAERVRRRLDGHNQLPKVILGVKFADGIETAKLKPLPLISGPHSKDDPRMKVTVIICTRNRSPQLTATLRSAQEMVIPKGLEWELLIVDNGSSDNTAEVVRSFRNLLPIRYVREEIAGLANARNLGVREAQGEYICWTDDDVLIDKEWLRAYVKAFENHPEASIFGGRVLPKLEAPTPKWFAKCKDLPPITSVLAKRDFGLEVLPVSIEGGRIPWGANYAVRTSDQRQHLYNPHLGVAPHHKRTAEEVQVISKLLNKGCSGWWVPDAKVDHIIPARRQSVRYIFEYFFSAGETWAFARNIDPVANLLGPTLEFRMVVKGVPARVIRFMLYHGTRFLLFRCLASPCIWLNELRFFAFYCGAAAYWRKAGYASN